MRWRLPKEGDTRTRTKFLLWPVTFGYERWWLERVTLVEEYRWRSGDWFPGGTAWRVTAIGAPLPTAKLLESK